MSIISPKNELQELLASRHLALPTYKTEGFAEHWACVVTVHWSDGESLTQRAEIVGKKKDAEQEAARKMLCIVRSKKSGCVDTRASAYQERGNTKPKVKSKLQTSPQGTWSQERPQERRFVPRETVEPATEQDIEAMLRQYNVEYLEQEGEEGEVLCMARTQVGRMTVASHGQARSLEGAKREAALHLIHNIHHVLL